MNTRWVPLVLAVIGATALCGLKSGLAQDAKPAMQEFRAQLKPIAESANGVRPMGPDADTCVVFEPEGIRIKLPTGYAGPKGWSGERPDTGVIVPVIVKGDFEITVGYEILQAPQKADAGHPQTRLTLDISSDRVGHATTTLSWRVQVNAGTGHFCWVRLGEERQSKNVWTRSKSGRLRMTRTGATVTYSVSDEPSGENFTPLTQLAFTSDPLEDIHVVGSTGGPQAGLEARVTDIVVHGQSLSRTTESTAATGPAGPAASHRTLYVGTAAVALTGLAVGLALWRRRSRSPATTTNAAAPAPVDTPAPVDGPIALACPSCGKKLKVRPELAGKQVACPQCGTAIRATKIKA